MHCSMPPLLNAEIIQNKKNIVHLFKHKNMSSKKPVAIIGAGIAGLTAANYLKEQNVPFVLYEAGKKIAGLASSFKDADGFSNDFGAHFVTNRLANAIGVGSDCLVVKHYGEAVWLNGKSYNYPFGLAQIPRMSLSFIKTKIHSLTNGKKPESAAEWFSNQYGTALAREVALPLLEAWSGAPAEELSASVGESLPGSILNTIYLKMASRITGRAVSCGYNREMPEKPSVWHVYPKGGVSLLCKKLAEGIEDSLRLESPVSEIVVKDEKVTAIKSKDETLEVAAVISTAPANILSRLVSGTHALDGIAQFRFRPMIFVNLRLQGRKLLPDTVLWFPEKEYPFFRITEVTRSMPWLAPEGKSIITVDIGCQKEDKFWTMDEDELTELCLKNLESVVPDIRDRFIGKTVLRTPIAYPVFLNEYEAERQKFERSTNIKNLISIGRNGEFAHRFMEDVYWRTRKKVAALIQSEDFNH